VNTPLYPLTEMMDTLNSNPKPSLAIIMCQNEESKRLQSASIRESGLVWAVASFMLEGSLRFNKKRNINKRDSSNVISKESGP